jgi:hypothetical protein
MLFMNNATTRTQNITNDFKLKVAFEMKKEGGYYSKGFIISLNDYSADDAIDQCLSDDCFYEF